MATGIAAAVVFVSAHGQLLARWRQAFPSARAVVLGPKLSVGGTGQLVWLHLSATDDPARALATARQAYPDALFVAMSDTPDDEQALACFAAGARAYCNSHAVPELLLKIADVVGQGGLWIGESLMARLIQGTARLPLPQPTTAPPDWSARLTSREREVALAVASGAANKEVARQLGITERTVKAHTGAIFEKLGVRDRLQLSLVVRGQSRH